MHRALGAAPAACLALAAAIGAAAQPLPQGTFDQGWGQAERERFWFTSQGSRLVPYSWFLHLEREGSEELLRSPSFLESLRYLPAPASAANPDALPIGFARDREGDWLGLTCAACHTGRIDHQGSSWLVEGGPALADFGRLVHELVRALQATAADDAKFARFSAALGDPAGLREEVRELAARLAEREAIDAPAPGAPPEDPGHARTDAFGQIMNQVSAVRLHDATNRNAPDAPVSYPALWGAPHADRVQWNGIAENRRPLGALLRNVGEVVGVFAELDLARPPAWAVWKPEWWRSGYESSVDFEGLGELEWLLWSLRAPAWPFAPPDPARVAAGRALYQENCKGCHGQADLAQGVRYETTLVPVSNVGTDPGMARNVAGWRCRSLALEGRRRYVWRILGEGRLASEEPCIELVSHAVVGAIVRHPLEAVRASLRGSQEGTFALEAAPADLEDALATQLGQILAEREEPAVSYRARPLHGVWATPPYLHNGSVPTLWQVLKPADRPASFCVGSREFDPVDVGLRSTCDPGTTPVDTRAPGHSNAGHDMAEGLSDAERRDLLEFLKTL
jgi:mono/diheme cytochrome c family protein